MKKINVDIEGIYRELEERMLRRSDYVGIPVRDNNELLVPVSDALDAKQIGTDMLEVTGDKILVREEVGRMLDAAANLLSQVDPDLRLQVVYGYRTRDIQSRLFQEEKNKLVGIYGDDELVEQAHRRIASPDVAGHPTGAAVDIQIIDELGEPLDFGMHIWDFDNRDSYVRSPFVGVRAKMCRNLLRTVMIASGFAPFDGEWWHFSYGDREWAKYYSRGSALYGPICEGDI